MRVAGEATRRLPRGVLRLEETGQPVVVYREAEVAEQLRDQLRILDLLHRAGNPEERLVVLPEVRRQSLEVCRLAVPDRLEPGAVAGGDQLRVVRELHQRVAPVEEDRLKHGR